jgi:hypothetical protein
MPEQRSNIPHHAILLDRLDRLGMRHTTRLYLARSSSNKWAIIQKEIGLLACSGQSAGIKRSKGLKPLTEVQTYVNPRGICMEREGGAGWCWWWRGGRGGTVAVVGRWRIGADQQARLDFQDFQASLGHRGEIYSTPRCTWIAESSTVVVWCSPSRPATKQSMKVCCLHAYNSSSFSLFLTRRRLLLFISCADKRIARQFW